jgi:hypothetical protein
LTGLFKNYNYAATGSPEHDRYLKQIDDLARSIPENMMEDDLESAEPAPDAA